MKKNTFSSNTFWECHFIVYLPIFFFLSHIVAFFFFLNLFSSSFIYAFRHFGCALKFKIQHLARGTHSYRIRVTHLGCYSIAKASVPQNNEREWVKINNIIEWWQIKTTCIAYAAYHHITYRTYVYFFFVIFFRFFRCVHVQLHIWFSLLFSWLMQKQMIRI